MSPSSCSPPLSEHTDHAARAQHTHPCHLPIAIGRHPALCHLLIAYWAHYTGASRGHAEAAACPWLRGGQCSRPPNCKPTPPPPLMRPNVQAKPLPNTPKSWQVTPSKTVVSKPAKGGRPTTPSNRGPGWQRLRQRETKAVGCTTASPPRHGRAPTPPKDGPLTIQAAQPGPQLIRASASGAACVL